MPKWCGKRNIAQTLSAPASTLPLNHCVLLGKHPNLAKLSSLLNFANLVCVCARVRMHDQSPSWVQFFATPWTVARQAPLSLGFSRQEYWSMWPFPSSGDLSDPGMEQAASPALASRFFTTKLLGKPLPTLVKVTVIFIHYCPHYLNWHLEVAN